MKEMLHYLKPYWRGLLAATIAVAISTVCDLLLPAIMSEILNKGVYRADFAYIVRCCAIMAAVALVGLGTVLLGSKISNDVVASFCADLRAAVFRKVNQMSFEEFGELGTAALVTRCSHDVETVSWIAAELSGTVIMIPVLFFGGVVLSLRKDVALSLTMLAFVPVILTIVIFIGKKIDGIWEVSDKFVDRQNEIMRERLRGIRVIRAFNSEKREHERVSGATRIMVDSFIRGNVAMGAISPLATFLLNVAAVLIVLLMRADAAFEGLMDMLPDTDWSEPLLSLFFGVFAGWILYSRGVGLKYAEKNGKEAKSFHGFSAITVNILLGTVCLIYAVYLLSQLAYLGGGFAGILPDGYTLAEYARRGFFEMAWLSFINLGLMCLAMGLVEKKAGAPALTRGLCLFLGLAALFLIAAASAKMLLYIGGYGLTRKRVLTEVFMLWLGVTTILVSVWLFKPRFPYMKGAVICALILGCVTFWADVDAQVARYNVRAYQSGQLETIDMGHMSSLGDGALPYIKELTHDRDPEIASTAMDILENSYCSISDFRSWTYTESAARRAVDAD